MPRSFHKVEKTYHMHPSFLQGTAQTIEIKKKRAKKGKKT